MINLISLAFREAMEARRAMKRGKTAIREAELERAYQMEQRQQKKRGRKRFTRAGA
jgi:hypothetical protein